MSKNTIVGKGYLNIRGQEEAQAAITPGHLLERLSTGKVQVHSVAGGVAEKQFALEDYFQGRSITDDYSAGEPVFMWHPIPGERVYAIAGGTIAIGDFLTSNGDGTLIAVSSAGEEVVGVAVEAAVAAGRFMVEIV